MITLEVLYLSLYLYSQCILMISLKMVKKLGRMRATLDQRNRLLVCLEYIIRDQWESVFFQISWYY